LPVNSTVRTHSVDYKIIGLAMNIYSTNIIVEIWEDILTGEALSYSMLRKY